MLFKDKNKNIIFISSIIFLIIIVYLWSNTENFEITEPAITSTEPAITSTEPAITSTEPAMTSTTPTMTSTTPTMTSTTPTIPITTSPITTSPMTSTTSPMTTHGYKISKNPQTNLYQQNFDGTSNVYAPYIYHNMEAFTPLNVYDDKLSEY